MIENTKKRAFTLPLNLFMFVCALLFTVGITYTADWFLYEWFYNFEIEHTDQVFYQLTKLFNSYNLEYESLFIFHISVSLLIYFILIGRLSRNYFYIFLIYLLLDYVHFTNQIRYYLGFPILMSGYYLLFYKKKYLISILLIILGILCHAGLATLLVFIPFFYFLPTKYFAKITIISSVVVLAIVYLLMSGGLGLVLEHYDSYFGKEYDSSIVGGLFNALPYITYYLFFAVEFPKLIKKKRVVDERKHNFLLKLTIFPLVFLPASFLLQILGYRYILPFAIFWVITYLYLINDLPQKTRFFKMLLFSIVHFIALFAIYELPDFFLPQNLFKKEVELTIQSIPYLKNLFY